MKKVYLVTYMFHIQETNNTTYGHCTLETKKKLSHKNFDSAVDYITEHYCNNNKPVILSIFKL